jgi:endoglucanase
MSDIGFMKIKGSKIIDHTGKEIILKGFGLGGWMNMEHFITGYPGNEEAMRSSLLVKLGEERYKLFIETFLENFFTEDDAKFYREMGFNTLRLPINYRHFEDDMDPFVIKEEGFKHLDRVIDLCAKFGIYTIIDLHAVAGYQNQDWHSDNPTHKALLWKHKHFQERTYNLWKAIALKYKNNPYVAGYDIINEPSDPEKKMIVLVSEKIIEAIRSVDGNHLIFLEGNRYSLDFDMFENIYPDTVYSLHNYEAPGFMDGGEYPGQTNSVYYDRSKVSDNIHKQCEYMHKRNLPIWVGEFGPVFSGNPDIDKSRFRLLADQLSVYKELGLSWSLWTYKDIGIQGIVYADPEGGWMKISRPILEKKIRLASDGWGASAKKLKPYIEPIESLMKNENPDYNPFPFGSEWQVNRMVRHILYSECLIDQYTDLFKNCTESEISDLMKSFLFKNCVIRKELVDVLKSSM